MPSPVGDDNAMPRMAVGPPVEPETAGDRSAAVTAAINQVLRQSLQCDDDEEVARVCLDVAQKLTSSELGFIGEVNPRGRFDTIAQSVMSWDRLGTPESEAIKMIRNLEIRGVWGRALRDGRSVIVNDPASHPDRVGDAQRPPADR
jgi:two-component system CheB/CheR fusion protein